MKIGIRAHDVELTESLRAHVELRVGFALGRFEAHLDSVIVRLSDTNDHKRCQIDVGLPIVKVDATDADLFAAVDRAAHRAARAVTHALDRSRTTARSAGPLGRWGLRAGAGRTL
jgi:ribosomal subunit interface protein